MRDLELCIRFLQELIRVPSLPGDEGALAARVATEMRRLGYDDVWTDEAGNVIGLIRGQGRAPAVMFNTHLDHVDVGDPNAWPFPPYAGERRRGRVWGRGAVDIKGPLAAQVYGVSRRFRAGERPPGDLFVTCVVQEEVGGVGARHLVRHLRPPYVVVGEPSGNGLRRGHRGRVELLVHVRGRSAHASTPERGINPLRVLANVIIGLDRLPMGHHPELGASSVAPTLIRTDQRSANVIPGEAWLTCDWRTVPGESAEDVRHALETLVNHSLIDGAAATVTVPVTIHTTYTGFALDVPASHPAYLLPQDHPALEAAGRVLAEVLSVAPEVKTWRFATDGGHFAREGLTVIGFGPGEEGLAHTVQESIAVEELEAALAGYAALAHEWPLRLAI
ncbi:MAG: M20/M25/M40 family metallo-hydrolase [Ardenticatenia bacterium]|nr:M20/M25/M40 family metallo-hydrolase [Ardenticatenia bacterium]